MATGQLGVVSRSQARAAGLSDDQLRGRVQSGLLHQLGPNVFRIAGAPVTPDADLRALLLDLGSPCWVAGPTAAALHGFDGFMLRKPFHVVVPRRRNPRRVGAVIHSTDVIDPIDREQVRGFPVTSPARTLIDLARDAPRDQLTRALDSAIRDGGTVERHLHERIVALRSRGRFGIPTLLDVIEGVEVTRGGHSWLERRFLTLVAGLDLPRPVTQKVLTRAGDRMVRVDCHFPGTRVVVELLGYRYHRSKQQLVRDAERMNALLLDGFEPYQFTYEQVVAQPDRVALTLRIALPRAA
jgi:hypothetical protein